jgi:hypothetical protein
MNGIYRPLKKLSDWETSAIVNFVGREFVQRSDLCAEALAEARRLLRARKDESGVETLVAHARLLLDDIDAMLATLDQASSRYQFATSATLHLELDRIEAQRRERTRAAKR